ncbi:MAG: peptidoglycan DD-metalloendopeptidase family protein [Clostridia bacterium]|nr:peptidoglycan DD-metalloendopeptidase family protein [Clostridia bacterium]
MMKTMRTRLTSLLTALVLLVTMTGSFASPTAAAPSIDDLEAQIKDLQEQEKEIKGSLAAVGSDLSASKARKELLEAQIDNAEAQIALLNQRISANEQAMAGKEREIADAELMIQAMNGDIVYIHERLGERLRAIAKTGNLSAVQRLLNTDNYVDYLLKSKAAECISKRDQDLIDQLAAELEKIETAKRDLETQKADLQTQREELAVLKKQADGKKNELDVLCAAVQTEIRNLQNTVDGYNDELKAVRDKIAEADAEIERIIKESQSVGRYDQDMMYWPVPAVRNISSYFGERWGGQHRGIDISEGPVPVYGQNIYAAADGVVLKVNYTNSWGSGWSYGYGYCVLVDHGVDSRGRKVTTMYAHCSKINSNIREGAKVIGGETVLGQVGRTGDVTGPHLHFEVRLDGTRVNPYPNYVHPDVNIPKGK